jgi:nitrogen fixation protein FixH
MSADHIAIDRRGHRPSPSPASGRGNGWRSRRNELTGRTVLVCLLSFFALVAGVNALMIRAAVSTFGGIETENAYQAGLAFSEQIAAARAQDALHWRVEAKVSPSEGASLIELTVHDEGNRPAAGLQAGGRLAHPTDRRADRALSFGERAPGTYRARTDAVHGQWILEIELSRAGEPPFRSRNRVFVR